MAHSITKEVKSIFRSFRSSTPEPPAQHPDGILNHTDISGHARTTSLAPNAVSEPSGSSDTPIVLIELFQSQGCNSCPPANDNVISFIQSQSSSSPQPSPSFPPRFYANRSPSPSVNSSTSTSPTAPAQEYLLLTYQVTYWNYLGWNDTFSLPANDVRQREYVRHMGLRSAYTPMVVVNGQGVGVGNSKSELERIVRDGTKAQSNSPKVALRKTLDDTQVGQIHIDVDATGLPPAYTAPHSYAWSPQQQYLEVWEVTYTPLSQDVHISRGENAGRTLPHLNVVKDVRKLGDVEQGSKSSFTIEDARVFAQNGALRRRSAIEEKVVVVQAGKGGPVVGVLKI